MLKSSLLFKKNTNFTGKYRISSNKRPRCILNFEAVHAALIRGRL